MEPPHKKFRLIAPKVSLPTPNSPRHPQSTRAPRTMNNGKRLPTPTDRVLRPRPVQSTPQIIPPPPDPAGSIRSHPRPPLCPLAPKPEPTRADSPHPAQSVSCLVKSTSQLDIHPKVSTKQPPPRPNTITTLAKSQLPSSKLNLASNRLSQRHIPHYPPGFLGTNKRIFGKEFDLDLGEPALGLEGGYKGMASHVEVKLGDERYLLGWKQWVVEYRSGMEEVEDGEGRNLLGIVGR